MEFTQLIAQRYSCKNFGTGKVDAAALHTILEAGRLAPTAKNTQEQRIYVVQSEEGLAKIDAATPCRYGAPICLVVAYDKNHTFTYPGERMNSGHGGCCHRGHPPAAGRCQCRRGQLLGQLF